MDVRIRIIDMPDISLIERAIVTEAEVCLTVELSTGIAKPAVTEMQMTINKFWSLKYYERGVGFKGEIGKYWVSGCFIPGKPSKSKLSVYLPMPVFA